MFKRIAVERALKGLVADYVSLLPSSTPRDAEGLSFLGHSIKIDSFRLHHDLTRA
jgi:hypothetical protein